jgi:EmrB/QacA subfamily drug resistance transporter
VDTFGRDQTQPDGSGYDRAHPVPRAGRRPHPGPTPGGPPTGRPLDSRPPAPGAHAARSGMDVTAQLRRLDMTRQPGIPGRPEMAGRPGMVAEANASAGFGARYTHRQVLSVLSALMMALLTSMISTSITGTALPTIVGDLGGLGKISWIASAALLTMTASTPLWGKLSDLFGRKLLFQLALVLFVAASAAAGLSQNIWELIAARAISGIGTGGLSALTQVILGDIVEPRERGRYSGYLGAAFGVSTVAGPLIGGFLVQGVGWRYCFFVSIPLAVVAFAMIQRILKLPRVRRDTKVDWRGAGTLTAGSAALILLLSLGGTKLPWGSPVTLVLVGVTVASLIGAIFAERAARDPILPPRLFSNRTFLLCSGAGLMVGMAMYGGIIYLPQYLQIVLGMQPGHSGLMVLPMVACMLIFSVLTGRLITRTGRWKLFPLTGVAMIAFGLYLMSRLGVDSSKVLVGTSVGVLGIGLGMTMQTLILAAQNSVGRADMAATTSGVAYFRTMGGTIGVAAFGAILTSRLRAELVAHANDLPSGTHLNGAKLGGPKAILSLQPTVEHVVRAAYGVGLHTVFLAAAITAAISWFVVLGLKEMPLRSAAERAREAAAIPAAVRAVPMTTVDIDGIGRDEALLYGLLLSRVVQRAARLRGAPSPLVPALAGLVPDAPGTDRERARAAVLRVLRPSVRTLLARATQQPQGGQ